MIGLPLETLKQEKDSIQKSHNIRKKQIMNMRCEKK